MSAVAVALSQLELGLPQVHGNLVMFPLIGPDHGKLDYSTLDTALTEGLGRVTEVSDAGMVNQLLFENLQDRPILLLDGEELVGAKQNRITNLTIMAPGRRQIHIPVSCVEKGRWAYGYGGEQHFSTGEGAHFAEGRAQKMREVTLSLAHEGSAACNQSSVWASVDSKMEDLDVHSRSSACTQISVTYGAELAEHTDAFKIVPHQRGAVFGLDDDFLGLEVFDREDTLRALLPKLIRSYAIDSISRGESIDRLTSQASAEAFLNRVREAECRNYDAVGEGTDIRILSNGIDGGGLMYGGVVVQLSVFRERKKRQGTGTASQHSVQERRHRLAVAVGYDEE